MLRTVDLSRHQGYIPDGHIQQLDPIFSQAKDVERGLARMAQEDPAARSLMHLKGIGFYVALVILTEISDLTRSPMAKHLTSYAGLVRRVHQSGDVTRTGIIHKEGPKRLRSMLIQCATASVRGSGRFQKFYKLLKKRKCHSKAIDATARKKLATVFVLLTRGCEYVEVDERNTRKKLMRMDRIAKAISDIDVKTTVSNLSANAKEVSRGDNNISNVG